MTSQEQLMELMSRPSPRLIEDIRKINGDIMVLGAGGKIGPSLCVMAGRAIREAGIKKRVLAVSDRYGEKTPGLMAQYGVEVHTCDLFRPEALSFLPDMENIIFMAGRKFGTSDSQPLTWAVNVLLPAEICKRFPGANFVVFSTGNVYGDVSALSGGSVETDEPNPDGEYGQTCLGRERVFAYFAEQNGTKSLMFRLNYAIGLNYGVLFDIADNVYRERPVSLSRGIYNCIWQGDTCEYAVLSLLHTTNPPNILNVTGPQCISTRWTAMEFGKRFGKTPLLSGEEHPAGLFSNTTKLGVLMGQPRTPLGKMIDLQARWIRQGGHSLNAPTHFEQSDGRY